MDYNIINQLAIPYKSTSLLLIYSRIELAVIIIVAISGRSTHLANCLFAKYFDLPVTLYWINIIDTTCLHWASIQLFDQHLIKLTTAHC